MPRSTVQFQRGLSLTSFLATYGTEEQCREALYRIRWPSGFCCPRCGHRSCFLIKTRMLYQCTGCRTQTSLMSGTVFGCSKLPLTIWFLAIFLITQSKNGISSLALSRSTGISPTAALRMKHKLQQAMKNHDDSLADQRQLFFPLNDNYISRYSLPLLSLYTMLDNPSCYDVILFHPPGRREPVGRPETGRIP
jgi:hypothetical protein